MSAERNEFQFESNALPHTTTLAWNEHAGDVCGQHGVFTVIDCQRCQFKHVVPLPSAQELAELYQEQFYRDDKPCYFSHYEEDESWWRLVYQERYGVFEQQLKSNSRRLLDVGSGPGLFLRVGAARGWDTHGIEPSTQAVAYSRERGAQVEQGFFEAAALPKSGMFDAIHLSAVLEHVPDPVSILQTATRALRPGGVLCVVVPNDFNPLQCAAQKAADLPSWWVAPPHHLNYFDFASLRNLLSREGWRVFHETTTFPMEMFLLMGQNYVGDGDKGRALHKQRMLWEQNLAAAGAADVKQKWYSQLASLGLGREVVMYAQR